MHRVGDNITLEEKKKIQLEILKRVHDICEENGLYYFLGGGSLIGAVRHKGYIPWDDDVDLMMPRDDYNRLLRIINKSKGRLYAFSAKSCGDYPYAFAKISDKCTRMVSREFCKISRLGIHIDIFPYDGIGGSGEITKIQYAVVRHMQAIRECLIAAGKENQKISEPKRVALKICIAVMTGVAKIFKVKNCERVGCIVAIRFGEKEIIRKEAFEKRILADFEQYQFYIPKGYDEYLRNLYGDYMSLPPQKDRRPGHQTRIIWHGRGRRED